jgi:hypothetical protein
VTTDVTEIPFDVLNYIDCPGEDPGRQICAVNGVAYHKSDMWTIMLEGMALNINGVPNFIKTNDNSQRYEVPQSTAPEANRELAQRIKQIGSTGNEMMDKIVSNVKENSPVVCISLLRIIVHRKIHGIEFQPDILLMLRKQLMRTKTGIL